MVKEDFSHHHHHCCPPPPPPPHHRHHHVVRDGTDRIRVLSDRRANAALRSGPSRMVDSRRVRRRRRVQYQHARIMDEMHPSKPRRLHLRRF